MHKMYRHRCRHRDAAFVFFFLICNNSPRQKQRPRVFQKQRPRVFEVVELTEVDELERHKYADNEWMGREEYRRDAFIIKKPE